MAILASAAKSPIGIAFNGETLNVEMGAYMAQHDIIYTSPPLYPELGMPLGDGDVGTLIWCDGRLMLRLNKTDLWTQNPDSDGRHASDYSLRSAAVVSILANPSPFIRPERYEQRLNLHSAQVSLSAMGPNGRATMDAFTSATAGVLVMHYQEQNLRQCERSIEITSSATIRPFAIGNIIGLMGTLAHTRYAVACRVEGIDAQANWKDAKTVSFQIGHSRTTEFTAYFTLVTCGLNDDPVAGAKSRLEAAVQRGRLGLLNDHREHWRYFWSRSFLMLRSHDEIAAYVEGLWYLYLYQMASCSRGINSSIPHGGLWFTSDELKRAVFPIASLQNVVHPLPTANHAELCYPYWNTVQHAILNLHHQPNLSSLLSFTGEPVFAENGSQETTDGMTSYLAYSLELWRQFRIIGDPMILTEHLIPTLIVVMKKVHHELEISDLAQWSDRLKALLAQSLAAGIQAAELLNNALDEIVDWTDLLSKLEPYQNETVVGPDGEMVSVCSAVHKGGEGSASALHKHILQYQVFPQGFWLGESSNAYSRVFDLEPASALATAVQDMLIQDDDGIIRLTRSLPVNWDATFRLRAAGAFEICSETSNGTPIYVAITSFEGNRCRIIRPWRGETVLRQGNSLIQRTHDDLIEFDTQPNRIYTIESAERPLFRIPRIRISGRRQPEPRRLGNRRLGF